MAMQAAFMIWDNSNGTESKGAGWIGLGFLCSETVTNLLVQ